MFIEVPYIHLYNKQMTNIMVMLIQYEFSSKKVFEISLQIEPTLIFLIILLCTTCLNFLATVSLFINFS